MRARCLVTEGIQAGLMGGLTVATYFFVGDLLHLHPLSTPAALGRAFIGPVASQIDFPVLAQIAAVATFGGRLLAITVLHLLAFSLLGVGAALLFDRLRWPLNPMTGALYGLLAGTGVFYASLAVGGAESVVGLPGPVSVATANGVAGVVMGTVFLLLRRRSGSPSL